MSKNLVFLQPPPLQVQGFRKISEEQREITFKVYFLRNTFYAEVRDQEEHTVIYPMCTGFFRGRQNVLEEKVETFP